jgi:hypothetical protein
MPFYFSAPARWKKYSRDTLASPSPYLGTAIGGAFDLAGNSPRERGQDAGAYGTHVGDLFSRNLVQAKRLMSSKAPSGVVSRI